MAKHHASARRCVDIIDGLHCGSLQRGTSILTHISRVGRRHVVDLEIVGVFHNGLLVEYVSAERILPLEFPLPVGLQRPYVLSHEYLLRDCYSTVIHSIV